MRRWLRGLPQRHHLEANKWLRPLAHVFANHSLWHLNRRSVARGVAVGVFFGFIVPFAQMFLAVLCAVPLRANVPVAVVSTFVSNPFTFVPIWIVAHRLGSWLLGVGHAGQPVTPPQLAFDNMHAAFHSAASVAGPTMLGLFVLGVVSAAVSFVVIDRLWRGFVLYRWGQRRPGAMTSR